MPRKVAAIGQGSARGIDTLSDSGTTGAATTSGRSKQLQPRGQEARIQLVSAHERRMASR